MLLGLACCAPPGQGHYHVLLPDRALAKKGEKVTFTLRFGHPFEHQFFDATAPEKLLVVAPDGKKTDLTKQLEKISLVGDKGKKKKTDEDEEEEPAAPSFPVLSPELKKFESLIRARAAAARAQCLVGVSAGKPQRRRKRCQHAGQ